MTPLSSASPYARFFDLKKYRHWTQIADWVTGAIGGSNTTARVAEGDLVDSSTTAGAVVKEHLMRATGLLESAMFRGNKYSVLNFVDTSSVGSETSSSTTMTTTELTALVTNLIAAGLLGAGATDLTAAQKAQQLTGASRNLLKHISCCLAIGSLSRFKTRTEGDVKDEQFGFEMLDALTSGMRIFGLVEAGNAGVSGNIDMSPPATDFEDDRPSVQADRIFGNRRRSKL